MDENEKRKRNRISFLALGPLIMSILGSIIFDYFLDNFSGGLRGVSTLLIVFMVLPLTVIIAIIGTFIKNTKHALYYYLIVNSLSLLFLMGVFVF